MLIEIERLIKRELVRDNNFITDDISVDNYIAKLRKLACFTHIVKDDSLIAFCAYYSNDNVNKVGFISMVIVAPDYRGKGVAEVIIESALKLMKLEGMLTCNLEVRSDNVFAIKLYEKLGFKPILENNKSLGRVCMFKNI